MCQIALNLAITSLEQGLLLGVVAIGVVIAFRFLDFPDLTVDGSFVLGAAVTARMIVSGVHPLLATVVAIPCGALAGAITGLLHTKLRVGKLLSGILMMTMLYSINLRVMGRSNIPLIDSPTVLRPLEHNALLLLACLGALAGAILLALRWLLTTELGVGIRAVGEGETMLASLGISADHLKLCGLALTNMLVALGGALFAQHQGHCDVTMGIGTILTALASIVVGEAFVTPLSPVRVLLAALVGAIIYQFLVNMALYLGLPATDMKLVTGLLIVGALLLRSQDRDTSLEAVARRY